MKLRILKLISNKPKTAIGVSLLDVISNALASIILLFFVFAALRGQPRPPERQVGILLVDFSITTPEKSPDIKIFLKRPFDTEYLVDSAIEKNLEHEQVDSVEGIWSHAIILSKLDSSDYTRRLVYINPEKTGKAKWKAGIIFSDHTEYTKKFNPNNFLHIKAYYVDPSGTKELQLNDIPIDTSVDVPTRMLETKFELPEYNK